MLIFSKPVIKYINCYLKSDLFKILIVGFLKGIIELTSLLIVLLYLNMFMGVEFDIPINIDLENRYVVISCVVILFLSFLVSYLSNLFMFYQGTKISEKHVADISKSFISQSFHQAKSNNDERSQYSKAKVISMACQETHRLNLNLNLPFIQSIFAILTISIIFTGLSLQFGYLIFTVFAFFIIMGILIRVLIIPIMRKGALLQKDGYRRFLEKYTYFAKSVFSQAISGKSFSFIDKVIAHFAEHNKGFRSNQVNGLNIKIGFETTIFLMVVVFVYLDVIYNFNDQVKTFLIANALASLRILPSAVNLARNLSIINSDTSLVKEHNYYIDEYLSGYSNHICDDENKQLQSIIDNKKPFLLHGPSGGGKTTLAKLIAIDLYKSNKSVAFLDSDPIFDPEIKIKSVSENLIKEHLIMLNLQNQGHRLFDPSETEFSRGQLQRIKLGMILKKEYEVIILDEALNGVENNLELDIIISLGELAKKNNVKLIIISHSKKVLDSELSGFVKEKVGA